ncbi:helix-turn-helix transcriptional regulator [Amycolatopsis australiensis]|uniref:DNA-binding transcriptional regulator, XRE-family HTH domain n=1 Tax=Amycolatopsis australiensis TaxID=546364 RepID=A0A1K1Q5D4_9PSEU|nr:helix-turn-helix domain-containing protein [Amycolatopsis australiensis]SFW54897.1 DNA-binding transcriptional regulator, XRE-family HTH domain [Amycolatopsis australiensis]
MSPQQGELFGAWLARQLRRAEMTQAQLAEQIPITRAAVSAWINGRAEPRPETQRRIADILGTDSASIYNRKDVTSDSPLRWHHRAAHPDGGREYGNPAAFAFDADLSMLAREATQNSLDERYDHTKPVRVRYTLHEITGEKLDAFLDAVHWPALRKHYAQAAAAEQKVSRSLQAALEDLDKNKSLVLLKIDDYNASGLTGDEYDDGRFAAVVRRQLDSHKESGKRAGGSYGLGKVTLWAASRFSLVLINSTLSVPHEGHVERRVIGRLDLPWREVDGEAYAGPAWYGQADTEPGRKDVSRSWWADEKTVGDLYLERLTDEPGTSFLIVGAHDASGGTESLQDMHEKLVKSLADSFWAAMIGGRDAGPLLEASVVTMRNGRVLIEEERVDPRRTHTALSRAFQAYLDGETVDELTSSTQVARADVRLVVPPRRVATGARKKVAEHNAVLLVTPAEDSDNQVNLVVYMRGNRQTIMAKRPRELPLGATRFHAVLLAGYATGREGDDVELAEQFLRASEPPEHDRWDHSEELTSTYAPGAFRRLREFRAEIDAAVRQLVGRRVAQRGEGPAALRELLKLDGFGSAAGRRTQGFPTVRNVRAHVDDTGAWIVSVDLKLPEADDPWLLTPVAKFDVRSGGRPAVAWKELVAAENCRRENDNLFIEAGVRSASFSGVTDPSTHPVSSNLARLIIDVQKARGGAA